MKSSKNRKRKQKILKTYASFEDAIWGFVVYSIGGIIGIAIARFVFDTLMNGLLHKHPEIQSFIYNVLVLISISGTLKLIYTFYDVKKREFRF